MKSRFILLLSAMFLGLLAPAGLHAQLPPELLGVERMEKAPLFYDVKSRSVREPRAGDQFSPLRVLLSRSRYWAEDGHLDVVVQLEAPAPRGELRVRISDAQRRELARFSLTTLPGPRFVLYPAIPAALARGGSGEIELTWVEGQRTLAEHRQAFRVEAGPEPAARSGRIRLHAPNQPAVTQRGVPVTVGVPFPRGLLRDASQLRLVDDTGKEHPLQVKETGRWSKFGSLKWVHCDFTMDLVGRERTLFLEYGPQVRRTEPAPIRVELTAGFPKVDAGRLRIDQGLWFDAAGNGNHVKVLDEAALSGAFVEHEDGRVYRAPLADRYEIEESGAGKVVLRREGWYREVGGEREFCRYIIRYVLHRDSSIVRIFHSWIFTGDGNRDRIRDMGWRFDLADGFERKGFLTSFGPDGTWAAGDHLLQHDFEHFEIVDGATVRDFPRGRAPGAAAAQGNGVRLNFGAKDFWQNYPSELEFRDGALWFHNWPRHNKPARYSLEGELITTPGAPADASAARHENYGAGKLTRSEWKLNVIQSRFAHEGELLDFRLPDRVAEDPIWKTASREREASIYWEKGRPESANAQGISRTEEMWLQLAPATQTPAQAATILAGLNDETLRVVADPAWVAASGAFYEIHHQDWERYPEEERMFELLALAPPLWQDRLGIYGKWVYGDLAIWGEVSLDRLEPQLYRGLRKRHHGWPYSWLPYARSGDPRLLRAAEAATRQNIDVNHCHYVSEDVRREVEGGAGLFHRRLGLLHRSTIPWTARRNATTRCYETQVDYLWHAWYLTGYHRAKDVVMDWARLTQIEENLPGRGPIMMGPSTRASLSVLQSYVENYEATFDPWFIVAAHGIAEGHRQLYVQGRYSTHGANVPRAEAAGHFWQAGDREFLRFTGDPQFQDYYMAYAKFWGGHWHTPSWQLMGAPMVEPNAYAWLLTGDNYYLRRLSEFLDWLKVAVWDGDGPDYVRGFYARGSGHAAPIFTGWALQYFPLALSALEKAGQRPPAEPEIFEIDVRDPVIAVKKPAGKPLALRLRATLQASSQSKGIAPFEITGPGGFRVSGEWPMEKDHHLEIPAPAPAGEYRVAIRNAQRIVVPLVEHSDVPEVMLFRPGEDVVLGRMNNQAWFFVPEGTKEFSVQVPLGGGTTIRRASVWGPDGQRVWNLNYHRESYTGEDPAHAVIAVPPEQAGRLWRITLPSSGARFKMDPKVPPVFAVSAGRWFAPEARAGGE